MTASDDRVARLKAAASARSAEKTKAAEAAVRRLVKAGKPVNFRTVQQEAAVSHAFLYAHPELRARIERLRGAARPTRPDGVAEARKEEGNVLAAVTQQLRESRREYEAERRRLSAALERALGENLALRRELAMPRAPSSTDGAQRATQA